MSPRHTSPMLIGRREELATLDRVLDRAGTSEPGHVLVAGEAGVGKSRLMAALAASAESRGMRVLQGACAHIGDGGVPYGPIVDALRTLEGDLDATTFDAVLGTDRSGLALLVPTLGQDGRFDSPVANEAAQSLVFEAVLSLLRRLAVEAPVLFIVEDLHWADPATRKTLAFLIRQLRADRVVLAMTFRADELHRRHPLLPWLAELDRGGRVQRIALERLDQDHTTALVEAILGGTPTAQFARRIFERSDGNPFFVEELLLADAVGVADQLSPSLREILLSRLATLSDGAQAVIGAVAVAGRQIDHDLLVRIAGTDEDAVLGGVREAVEGQVLVTGGPGHGTSQDYLFRHALFQEAAYDDLLPGERQRLHRALAGALAERSPGVGADAAAYWAELAYHWGAARDDARCFVASVRAGEAATSAFAFADARVHLERALELWSSVDDPAGLAGLDRIGLLEGAAVAAWHSGDARRAIVLRRDVVAALGSSPDPLALGTALERLSRVLWSDGQSDAALEACEAAVAAIPADPPTAERARVLSGYGQLLMLLDHWEASKAACREAIDIARQVGARQAEGHALNTLGLDLTVDGLCAEGIAALHTALEIAREVSDPDDIGRAYVMLSEATFDCGDPRGALEVIREGIPATGEVGVAGSYGSFVRDNGVAIAFELGAWDEAMRYADESESISEVGHQRRRYLLSKSVPLLVAAGDERATDRLESLGALIEGRLPEAQFHAPYRVARAESALWRGSPDEALATVRVGAGELTRSPWHWHHLRLYRLGMRAVADLAQAARARRDPSAAAAALADGTALLADVDPILERARSIRHGADLTEIEAEVLTIQAEWDRARGDDAADAWQGAADAWTERANPYLTAYARWRQGEALLEAGDRPAAVSALIQANAIAVRLGARPLAAAIVGLATRARVDLDRDADAAGRRVEPAAPSSGGTPTSTSADADSFGLTRRERDVLPLLVEGWTNRQIADSLFISENTAGVHVSNILGKLGASTRTEAATIAVRAGIVDTELDEAPSVDRG